MKQKTLVKAILIATTLTAITAAGVSADAQNVLSGKKSGQKAEAHIGMVQDWSNRHVVFTKARTFDETVAARLSQPRWDRMAKDPRYVMALTRRFQSEASAPAGQTVRDSRRGHPTTPTTPVTESTIIRDWSNVLGGGADGLGGKGIEGMFPAKYNFDVGAAPDCANDFIVYPTNTAGNTSTGSPETRPSTFSDRPDNNSTFTIGVAGSARSVVLTAVDSVTPAVNQFYRGANTGTAATRAAIAATNMAAAVRAWTGQTGITATADAVGNVVFARISNSNTASISITGSSNYTVGTRSNGSGVAGQPTIIAFNQLYNTTCNAGRGTNTNAPNVMWSYNTGTGYSTETSPVLSYYDDAKQVAFIQRSGTSMQLVLLKPKAGNGTAGVPVVPALAATAADYRNGTGLCAGGVACMYKITFSTATLNALSYSSPFVDFAADVLWAGDNNGRLHKFTGVFTGTPIEVTPISVPGSSFPVTVAAGLSLSAPVYDFAGSVYVGSQSAIGTEGGKMHRINASTGQVFSSIKLANTTQASTGLRESPIVTDQPGSGSVFGFLFNDGTAGNGQTCDIALNNDNACRTVARFPLGFADGASPAERSYAGRGNNFNSTLFAGAFNEAYYNGTAGAAMYIVGGEVVDTFIPTLWKIPIVAGVLQQSIKGPALGPKTCNTVANCITDPKWNWSPVTLVKNGANEYFYFSMPSSASLGGCTGACLFMFNTANLQNTNPTVWATTNVPRAVLPVFGGTGGIVFDNISATTGTSQVYFSHLANGGNAVQASQSGLN